MVIELVGQERKQLRKAIINAYPNISKLRIMVREELDENLDQIAGVGELNTVVFDLIGWAESTGKVKELVEAAYKGNPGNEQLQAVRKQLLSSEPSDCRQAESFQEDLGNRVFLEMVKIPGGHFMMGSPEDEVERTEYEEPQHIVTISPFFMGKFPITQLQYQTIMGENPSRFKGINKPVESVSWDNAVDFCGRISKRTGKTYRLPSEAEWEYACRAGTTTPFHFGETINTDLANYDGNYTYGSAPKGQYRNQTTDVGNFPANAFGLYDMHGNVWELCEDRWHENYNGAPYNGDAWVLSSNDHHSRLLRGGSWDFLPRNCRSAFRFRSERDNSDDIIGFRVVVASSRTS